MSSQRHQVVLAGAVAFEVAVGAAEDEARAVLVALDVDVDGHAVDRDGGAVIAHSENYSQPAERVKSAGQLGAKRAVR